MTCPKCFKPIPDEHRQETVLPYGRCETGFCPDCNTVFYREYEADGKLCRCTANTLKKEENK